MGFTYLHNNKWEEITREERFFCSHLFYKIKQNTIKNFINFLNSKNDSFKINSDNNWDIGYEVCFYRDILHMRGDTISNTEYSPKRTFDLCLFSNSNIIILEAKAHEQFKRDNIALLRDDKNQIPDFIKQKDMKIKTISIASSNYYKQIQKKEK